MSGAAIKTAARARLAVAFAGWTDTTEAVHPVKPDELPAFSVGLSLAGGERVAMGNSSTMRDGELLVTLRTIAAPGTDLRAALWDHEAAAVAALMAAPADLGGAVWSILPGGADPDTDAAKERVGTIELAFAVQVLT